MLLHVATANPDVQGQQTSPQLHHHHASRPDIQAGSYPHSCNMHEVAMYINIIVKVKH